MSVHSRGLLSMKVGTRFLLVTAIPLVLFSVFAAWLWWSLIGVEDAISRRLVTHQSMALLAQNMQRDVVQVQQYLSDVSATRGEDGLDDGFKLAADYRDRFKKDLSEYVGLAERLGGPSPRARAESLALKFDTYYEVGVDMANAYVSGGPPQGNRVMPQFDASAEALHQALLPFVEEALQTLTDESQHLAGQTVALRTTALVLVAGIGALMFLTGRVLSQGITRRLALGLGVAQAITNGDLSKTIRIDHGGDEITALLNALESMRSTLVEMISRVQGTAEDVADAAHQIAHGNTELSSRTELQASSLEQTASGMEQLRSTVTQTSDNARHASALATRATDAASRGGQVVEEVVVTIGEISHSSSKIASIIGVIDSIAFQTNILALNAAVEAARAGEQGRGFAVVASEVRGLAGRSATAAQEIKRLIEDSVGKVSTGTALAGRAGETMQEVVGAIKEAAALIADINTAAAAQSQGVSEATSAVMLMEEGTRHNAAMVERLSSTAARLNQGADTLVGLTAAFRLG